ncbi:hypothetical protein M5689_024565 [Euphorbia peplus]|nr:hypothetical protein M5689_024565 [Euphorbia peplus]
MVFWETYNTDPCSEQSYCQFSSLLLSRHVPNLYVCRFSSNNKISQTITKKELTSLISTALMESNPVYASISCHFPGIPQPISDRDHVFFLSLS